MKEDKYSRPSLNTKEVAIQRVVRKTMRRMIAAKVRGKVAHFTHWQLTEQIVAIKLPLRIAIQGY